MRHQRFAAPSGLGRQVDEGAGAARIHHRPQHLPHHDKHALDVDVDDAFVHRQVRFQQGRHVEYGRIVEQDIDGAEAFGGQRQHGPDRASVAHDGAFLPALTNTFVLMFSVMAITVVLGIALGLLINDAFPGRAIVRVLLISPILVMPAVNALMWKNMLLNPIYGLVAHVSIFFGATPVDWLSEYPLLANIAAFFLMRVIGKNLAK